MIIVHACINFPINIILNKVKKNNFKLYKVALKADYNSSS